MAGPPIDVLTRSAPVIAASRRRAREEALRRAARGEVRVSAASGGGVEPPTNKTRDDKRRSHGGGHSSTELKKFAMRRSGAGIGNASRSRAVRQASAGDEPARFDDGAEHRK